MGHSPVFKARRTLSSLFGLISTLQGRNKQLSGYMETHGSSHPSYDVWRSEHEENTNKIGNAFAQTRTLKKTYPQLEENRSFRSADQIKRDIADLQKDMDYDANQHHMAKDRGDYEKAEHHRVAWIQKKNLLSSWIDLLKPKAISEGEPGYDQLSDKQKRRFHLIRSARHFTMSQVFRKKGNHEAAQQEKDEADYHYQQATSPYIL